MRELIEKMPDSTIAEMVEALNKTYGTAYTYEQVKGYVYRHKIKFRRNVRHNLLITDEQAEILMRIIPGRSTAEASRLFEEETGVHLSRSQVSGWKKNHKCPSGYDTRYRPGHVSTYTTPKGRINGGTFKKGHISANSAPIGTEDVRDGYLYVKIQNGHKNKNWKQKSHIVWEAAHGPVPEGMKIIFLDGDPMNCSLDNLELVSQGELSTMNLYYKLSKDKDINRAVLGMAKLKRAIAERKRERDGSHSRRSEKLPKNED